jgi:hypothetical protein
MWGFVSKWALWLAGLSLSTGRVWLSLGAPVEPCLCHSGYFIAQI